MWCNKVQSWNIYWWHDMWWSHRECPLSHLWKEGLLASHSCPWKWYHFQWNEDMLVLSWKKQSQWQGWWMDWLPYSSKKIGNAFPLHFWVKKVAYNVDEEGYKTFDSHLHNPWTYYKIITATSISQNQHKTVHCSPHIPKPITTPSHLHSLPTHCPRNSVPPYLCW